MVYKKKSLRKKKLFRQIFNKTKTKTKIKNTSKSNLIKKEFFKKSALRDRKYKQNKQRGGKFKLDLDNESIFNTDFISKFDPVIKTTDRLEKYLNNLILKQQYDDNTDQEFISDLQSLNIIDGSDYDTGKQKLFKLLYPEKTYNNETIKSMMSINEYEGLKEKCNFFVGIFSDNDENLTYLIISYIQNLADSKYSKSTDYINFFIGAQKYIETDLKVMDETKIITLATNLIKYIDSSSSSIIQLREVKTKLDSIKISEQLPYFVFIKDLLEKLKVHINNLVPDAPVNTAAPVTTAAVNTAAPATIAEETLNYRDINTNLETYIKTFVPEAKASVSVDDKLAAIREIFNNECNDIHILIKTAEQFKKLVKDDQQTKSWLDYVKIYNPDFKFGNDSGLNKFNPIKTDEDNLYLDIEKNYLVVGAGPSGLRTAIQLRLSGYNVHLIENRFFFNRINTIYLWNWSKVYDMKFLQDFNFPFLTGDLPYKTKYLNNIGVEVIHTKNIQINLLKIACLIGVNFSLIDCCDPNACSKNQISVAERKSQKTCEQTTFSFKIEYPTKFNKLLNNKCFIEKDNEIKEHKSLKNINETYEYGISKINELVDLNKTNLKQTHLKELFDLVKQENTKVINLEIFNEELKKFTKQWDGIIDATGRTNTFPFSRQISLLQRTKKKINNLDNNEDTECVVFKSIPNNDITIVFHIKKQDSIKIKNTVVEEELSNIINPVGGIYNPPTAGTNVGDILKKVADTTELNIKSVLHYTANTEYFSVQIQSKNFEGYYGWDKTTKYNFKEAHPLPPESLLTNKGFRVFCKDIINALLEIRVNPITENYIEQNLIVETLSPTIFKSGDYYNMKKDYSVFKSGDTIIAAVGDCLKKPRWTQGIGVNGAFLSALDLSWLLYKYNVSLSSFEKDVSYRYKKDLIYYGFQSSLKILNGCNITTEKQSQIKIPIASNTRERKQDQSYGKFVNYFNPTVRYYCYSSDVSDLNYKLNNLNHYQITLSNKNKILQFEYNNEFENIDEFIIKLKELAPFNVYDNQGSFTIKINETDISKYKAYITFNNKMPLRGAHYIHFESPPPPGGGGILSKKSILRKSLKHKKGGKHRSKRRIKKIRSKKRN